MEEEDKKCTDCEINDGEINYASEFLCQECYEKGIGVCN